MPSWNLRRLGTFFAYVCYTWNIVSCVMQFYDVFYFDEQKVVEDCPSSAEAFMFRNISYTAF